MDTISTEGIHEMMASALMHLRNQPKSRELSLAITNLEQSLMWFNKNRTIKGELTPTATHV